MAAALGAFQFAFFDSTSRALPHAGCVNTIVPSDVPAIVNAISDLVDKNDSILEWLGIQAETIVNQLDIW